MIQDKVMGEQQLFGLNPKVNMPTSRSLELFQKKKTQGLTHEEEGELRGLFAHPDNPEAQVLLKKEYLSYQGLAEITAEEKERLRVIRAEKYARESTENQCFIDKGHLNNIEGGNNGAQQAVASANEFFVLYAQSKIMNLEGRWESDPMDVINGVIHDTPDSVTVYTKETLHLMPKDEPSELELYFLSKIQNSPNFMEDNRPEGALRIMESIRCLRDKVRTKKFLMGISEALTQINSSDKEYIEMCDAGTGAIPILAIYAALLSEKVRCTALELNEKSAEIARSIVRSLGLQDRITILQQDAITYTPQKQFDLLVSETMHSGLTAEPIVQILTNLKKFVKEDGITLPTSVQVKAALVSLNDWVRPEGFVKIYGNMHQVVSPQWKDVAVYKPGDDLKEILFSLSVAGRSPGSYFVLVGSEVSIGSQRIDLYQSLVTMPQFLMDTKSDPEIFDIRGKNTRIVEVRYEPGKMLNNVGQLYPGKEHYSQSTSYSRLEGLH